MVTFASGIIAEARMISSVETTSSSTKVKPRASARPTHADYSLALDHLTVTVTGANCNGISTPSGPVATPLTWIIDPPAPTASNRQRCDQTAARCAGLVARPRHRDVDSAGRRIDPRRERAVAALAHERPFLHRWHPQHVRVIRHRQRQGRHARRVVDRQRDGIRAAAEAELGSVGVIDDLRRCRGAGAGGAAARPAGAMDRAVASPPRCAGGVVPAGGVWSRGGVVAAVAGRQRASRAASPAARRRSRGRHRAAPADLPAARPAELPPAELRARRPPP